MDMELREALEWLYGVRRFGPKRTLGPTTYYLEKLGNPHHSFNSIHIAGTNGKGSTSAITASILQEAGFKVGLYTSPHLVRFNERIKVDGEEIGDRDLARLLTQAHGIFQEMLSLEKPMPLRFFDIATGVAFKYFQEQGVDFAVVEVGLGGRLDATNVLAPLVSVITNIGLEHVNILGPTLEDIAGEKAGIIKEGVPVVTGEVKPNVLRVFQRVAQEKNTTVIQARAVNQYYRSSATLEGQTFNLKTPKRFYESLWIPLLGLHQVENASTSIAAIEQLSNHGFEIPPEAVRRGLAKARWPGRLEVVRRNPLVILDCAKDAEATSAIRTTFNRDLPTGGLVAVVAISSDKNIPAMIHDLAQVAEYFILTTHSVKRRSADPHYLAQLVSSHGKPYQVEADQVKAFKAALTRAGEGGVVLVVGSVYLAGDARRFFLGESGGGS